MTYTPDEVALAAIVEGQTARTTGPVECRHPVITPRGIQIALATEIVESNERVLANPNVPESENYPNDGDGYDHDSAGPFQQQYEWWGTVSEEMDLRLSAAMFYNHLAKLDYNNTANSPGSYAQAVQGSAFPDRYDQHFQEAVDQYNRLTSGGNVPQPVGPPPFTETDLTLNNNNCESREGYSPRLIILHTEEGGMQGSAFVDWMANNNVSYGYIVNPDGSVDDMETDDVASWSVLDPANEFSINICFATSTVNWTRQQWLDNMTAGIRSAAYLAVRKCLAFNIPIQILVGKDYPRVKTEGGITDHNAITVTGLSPGSTHTDVGPNFPWDVFAEQLARYTPAPPAPTPAPAPAPFQYPSTDEMVQQIWEQLFGPQASGWPNLFGQTADGSRGKFTVEAIADIHSKES
jgi:N-acetyl-anhydromuramyl-L-alanine amidase AmpD